MSDADSRTEKDEYPEPVQKYSAWWQIESGTYIEAQKSDHDAFRIKYRKSLGRSPRKRLRVDRSKTGLSAARAMVIPPQISI